VVREEHDAHFKQVTSRGDSVDYRDWLRIPETLCIWLGTTFAKSFVFADIPALTVSRARAVSSAYCDVRCPQQSCNGGGHDRSTIGVAGIRHDEGHGLARWAAVKGRAAKDLPMAS
jgi:hypothetical protein